jgi:hypothetical protein
MSTRPLQARSARAAGAHPRGTERPQHAVDLGEQQVPVGGVEESSLEEEGPPVSLRSRRPRLTRSSPSCGGVIASRAARARARVRGRGAERSRTRRLNAADGFVRPYRPPNVPWRSAPTDAPSRPPATTGRSACGRRSSGPTSPSCKPTSASSSVEASARPSGRSTPRASPTTRPAREDQSPQCTRARPMLGGNTDHDDLRGPGCCGQDAAGRRGTDAGLVRASASAHRLTV